VLHEHPGHRAAIKAKATHAAHKRGESKDAIMSRLVAEENLKYGATSDGERCSFCARIGDVETRRVKESPFVAEGGPAGSRPPQPPDRAWTGLATLASSSAVPSDVEFITLPDGRVLGDAIVWQGFCQGVLGLDPGQLWQELTALPTWASDKPIPFRRTGDDVHWIRGDHNALNYRGNAIKRHKMWFQADFSRGLRRYRYPGWTNAISAATHDVRHVPGLDRFTRELNGFLRRAGQEEHNHWIVTRYDDKGDNIGFHSDNDEDFAPDSYFVVVKLGKPRPFEFCLVPPERDAKPVPFYSRALPAGTAVFVRVKSPGGDDANSIIQHGVPVVPLPVGLSGSIVSRHIDTLVPWADIQEKVRGARERKLADPRHRE